MRVLGVTVGDQKGEGGQRSEGQGGLGNTAEAHSVSECVVCMEANKSFICVPCMHVRLCSACAGPIIIR
eukprot:1688525-Rhodomonas_salina.2